MFYFILFISSTFIFIYILQQEKLTRKLWGENYFNTKEKKWGTENISASGEPLTRSFCQFVIRPISQLTTAIRNNDVQTLQRMLTALGITLTAEVCE
jgi:elongation factor 2